ncbi:MAG: hypothetical protein IPM56_11305 [Ignavibacteriales bacterium]|nr:MAG: hypothetical protein IPM56_11305 [Ignavibacteriales bacterium]
MFITLLLVTFGIALLVSFLLVKIFTSPINKILERIIADTISIAWSKYLRFAMYVTGISSGVRIWQLEVYITPEDGTSVRALTSERWILEVYRTIIETMQGIAWMLLVFFIFALIAFVIVRVFELKRKLKDEKVSD